MTPSGPRMRFTSAEPCPARRRVGGSPRELIRHRHLRARFERDFAESPLGKLVRCGRSASLARPSPPISADADVDRRALWRPRPAALRWRGAQGQPVCGHQEQRNQGQLEEGDIGRDCGPDGAGGPQGEQKRSSGRRLDASPSWQRPQRAWRWAGARSTA